MNQVFCQYANDVMYHVTTTRHTVSNVAQCVDAQIQAEKYDKRCSRTWHDDKCDDAEFFADGPIYKLTGNWLTMSGVALAHSTIAKCCLLRRGRARQRRTQRINANYLLIFSNLIWFSLIWPAVVLCRLAYGICVCVFVCAEAIRTNVDEGGGGSTDVHIQIERGITSFRRKKKVWARDTFRFSVFRHHEFSFEVEQMPSLTL